MKMYFRILVFAVHTYKEEKKFNTHSEGLGRRLQLNCHTCIYYTNDGLIIRGIHTYTNDSLIVCVICTRTYLYYDRGTNIEIINTKVSPHK
jgi:hypothetical protein